LTPCGILHEIPIDRKWVVGCGRELCVVKEKISMSDSVNEMVTIIILFISTSIASKR
jgi:hypothetical protein